MKILIIEDEARIARRLKRMVGDFFSSQLISCDHREEVEEGLSFLGGNEVDLLLLDLNLNGENGFAVLRQVAAASCHVIIVSAYHEKALEAFEYGVLDFVPKPFNAARLFQAFARLGERGPDQSSELKYLTVTKKGSLKMLTVADLRYVRGAGIYTELVMRGGNEELSNKSLDKLADLLPSHFFRLHKSYLVNLKEISEIKVAAGGKYTAVLKDSTELPIGRTRYRELRNRLGG